MTTPQSSRPRAVEATKKELFLLVARALTDEEAQHPGDRFAALVHELALADDDWLQRLADWTRAQPVLRRTRLAITVGSAHVRLEATLRSATETRRLISEALVRADEPGELLAYAADRYGRSIPKPIKAGVAKAAERLYDEHALATYDTADAPMRFSEVIDLTHAKPVGQAQREVFQHAAQRLRLGSHPVPEALTTLRARAQLQALPAEQRVRTLDGLDAADMLAKAAMTWQQMSAWLNGEMTDKVWATVLPSMSYRQRLAHLRDFETAGLAGEVADWACAELAEEGSVARGRAMPVEILAAYRSVPASRWSWALEQALSHSLAQVPALSGRTLILVDRSAAMASRADAAAVFAAALALRSPSVELVEFGPATRPVTAAASVLATVDRFSATGGAQTVAQAVPAYVEGHDRIIVLTHPGAAVEAVQAVTAPGHEHVISQINDGWFAAIPAIESARTGAWPF
ncbi:RNA-binding protein [Acrocarpospora pleiomorpha]|uniref:RNA-binding protein n=2 Tax=Acrocarpospora pleiomorpha TaxID=90975 RepID=A0A5M3XI80_9ACTN|nr:RNA-binding protein [Acrocarpospora pleiomorpha]